MATQKQKTKKKKKAGGSFPGLPNEFNPEPKVELPPLPPINYDEVAQIEPSMDNIILKLTFSAERERGKDAVGIDVIDQEVIAAGPLASSGYKPGDKVKLGNPFAHSDHPLFQDALTDIVSVKPFHIICKIKKA